MTFSEPRPGFETFEHGTVDEVDLSTCRDDMTS